MQILFTQFYWLKMKHSPILVLSLESTKALGALQESVDGRHHDHRGPDDQLGDPDAEQHGGAVVGAPRYVQGGFKPGTITLVVVSLARESRL
jgi:hypothetical protein